MGMFENFSRCVAVAVLGVALQSCSSSSSGSQSNPNGDQILKSTECVTVVGLNEGLEVEYESGRIEVLIVGGQVPIEGGVSVRWCRPERPAGGVSSSDSESGVSDSDATLGGQGQSVNPTQPQTYNPELECGGLSGSFEQLKDGTSTLRCSYTLPSGKSGEAKPVLNGRSGTVLKTDGMTNVDDLESMTICFGLFADGQVVVAGKLLPSGLTCEQLFLQNSKPEPVATDLKCPPGGNLEDLKKSGGDSSTRCVAVYADGSQKIKIVDDGTYNHSIRVVTYTFFRDSRWNGKFCLVMNRSGAIRSNEVLEDETTCR
jgi:hypothetical protein